MLNNPLRDKLKLILDEQLVLYRKMHGFIKEEYSLLTGKLTPAALMAVTAKKAEMIEQLKRKDQELRLVFMDIAAEAKLKIKDITLKQLSQIWKDRTLLVLNDDLKAVLDRINTDQQINNKLIKEGNELITDCLKLMHTGKPDAFYGPGGNMHDATAANLNFLDRKA